jgi:uncharacterized membrane protein YqiK
VALLSLRAGDGIVTAEREAALVAIKEAAERLERTTRAVAEAERDLAQALADYRKANGEVLHVTALSGPIGSVWRDEKWHP